MIMIIFITYTSPRVLDFSKLCMLKDKVKECCWNVDELMRVAQMHTIFHSRIQCYT